MRRIGSHAERFLYHVEIREQEPHTYTDNARRTEETY